MRTPSEKVNPSGATHLRLRATGHHMASGCLINEDSKQIRTRAQSVDALRLANEAVDFVHVSERGFRPSLSCNHAFDFFPHGLNVLGIRREVVKHMCERLDQRVGNREIH